MHPKLMNFEDPHTHTYTHIASVKMLNILQDVAMCQVQDVSQLQAIVDSFAASSIPEFQGSVTTWHVRSLKFT